MAVEIIAEIFQGTLQRFHGTRCQSTVGIAHSAYIFNLIGQGLEILELTAAILYVLQHLSCPGQPFTTGGAETTGFMGKETNQIQYHAHWTGLVIENN